MRSVSRLASSLASLLAVLLVTACGSAGDSTLVVAVIGSPDDPFERGARLSLAGQLVRAASAEGLVAFDAEGRVIPALADRWIVTDDGQSYIFRLRDGTWPDGSELDAKSAQLALRRAIRDLQGTSLGLDLAGIDEARAMTERVIEIRLSQPMPHLLELLAQPELGLFHKKSGSGPMRLDREGDTALLRPIDPAEIGLPKIERWKERARTIRLTAEPAPGAVERFNKGEADLLLGGRIEDFPLSSSVGILRGTIKLDPVMGLFGLQVARSDGFLSEPENREALAMAIDRNALIAPFGVGGWTASTLIVPTDVAGDPGSRQERWAAMTMENRRAAAAARIASWRGGQEAPEAIRLRIALPQGPGSDLLFGRLSSDFAAVGLEAVRVATAAEADLRLIDDVARYPRANWFLNRLNCTVQRGLCSKEADEALARARRTADPAERAALVAEAEAKLTEANVFIPFGSPIRWSLVRGDAIGFSENAWAWHPLMPMALLPR